MARRLLLPVLLASLLGACTAQGQGQISVTPVTGASTKPAATAKPAAPVGRLVSLQVNAPVGLVAAGGGNIVNADVPGMVAAGGGNLVAAGGGNLVAAGGGNLVAAGGGNYRLAPAFRIQQAAIEGYKPVEKAVVMFRALTPDGELVDKTAGVTDASGAIKFSGVLDRALIATAYFKVGDKTYEMTAPIAKGEGTDAVMVDPINTFVTARIRTILQTNKLTNAAVATVELQKVWTHFNDAKVTPDVTALEKGTTLADLNKFYTDNIGKLPQAGQDAVKAYMQKIGAGQS